jgi:hypothetical protein
VVEVQAQVTASDDRISLRDYLESILESHDRAHMAEHKAVELAAKEMERRVEGLNQLRQDVVADRSLFVTKEAVQTLLDAAAERNNARDEKTKQLADALEDKTHLLEKAIDERIKPLEQNVVTTATLNAYKKVLYGTLVGAGVAFGIALFNLITKNGGG